MIGMMRSGLRQHVVIAAAALLVVAAPALVPVRVDAEAKGVAGTAIRVATWNLTWFGHPKVPRSSEQLGKVAENIASWGVHVLAFQEVAVTRLGPGGAPRSYAMDELVAILADEYNQGWEYWIHKDKGEQHLGYMWRTDTVDLVAAPLFGLKNKPVENLLTGKGKKAGKHKTVKKPPWERIPVIAHVGTGDGLTDFTLINVHLRQAQWQFGKESFWESRRAACESLAGWIDKTWNPPPPPQQIPAKKKKGPSPIPKAFVPAPLLGVPIAIMPPHAQMTKVFAGQVLGRADPDLAVLGDFNSPVKPEMVAEPLFGMGMHYLGGKEPTHWNGTVLDRVLVSLPMGEEHALSMGSSPPGQAFSVSGPGKKGGFDHQMVSFTVAVRADDD